MGVKEMKKLSKVKRLNLVKEFIKKKRLSIEFKKFYANKLGIKDNLRGISLDEIL